jgi:hypothetical protein
MALEMNAPIKKYLKKLLTENYQNFIKDPLKEKKKISDEIDTLNNKLSFARNKFLSEIIDDDEYLVIKKECKDQISKLEKELNKSSIPQISNIDKLLEQALATLQNIGKLYQKGEIEVKRAIIGSIFPEKLEFDGKHYRTARINSIAHHIFQINNELDGVKKRETIKMIISP